ncbi:hypothetical protein [Paenibacillus lemnae]|uniref:Uncharacterized protein n=1 Tax=Paenibacillus lemnae TaxID=1330551 RepID=A0A848MB10_PAELE|nr:hypothetical protein [Paenibacillus lemnae]NMO97716.1 hypothetical protein [Paenibacillus lemnae]
MLDELCGKQILNIKVHIVDPEINMILLEINECWFGIFGAVGSEILEVNIKSDIINKKLLDSMPLKQLVNHYISGFRFIGEVWNGYGVEFSFKGVFDKTLMG